MEYLLTETDTYRVATIEDAEKLHNKLMEVPFFDLVGFSYKTKYVKEKGEIIDEYQICTAKKVFNMEKEPDSIITIDYQKQEEF